MKIFTYLMFTVAFLSACVSRFTSQAEYESLVTNFLNSNNNSQITYREFEVTDVTVADSIQLLKEQFEEEKKEKIESSEFTISMIEGSIANMEKEANVKQGFMKTYRQSLADEKDVLVEVRNWQPDYLNRYKGQDPSTLLCKKVTALFTLYDPDLQTGREISAIFILSANVKECKYMVEKSNKSMS